MTTDTDTAPAPDATEAPPKQEALAAPSGPPAVAWGPYGHANLPDRLFKAIQADSRPGDPADLTLRLTSSRPIDADTSARAREVEKGRDSRVMDALAQTPQYRHLTDLRPQVKAAERALAKANAKAEAARKRHQALSSATPSPANLAAKLVAAKAACEQAEAEADERGEELAAIEGPWELAKGAVADLIPGICQRLHAATYDEVKADLEERFGQLMAEAAGHFRELWTLRRVMGWVQQPRVAELAAGVLASAGDPDSEGNEAAEE
jgi:hypothetical protein